MADDNFKDSFNILQLLAFLGVFTGLLLLAPILRWWQILA